MLTHPGDKKTGPRPDPVDVARLHAAGVSRNGTARALEVSTRQVDAVAAELGLSWSADAPAEAVAVRRSTAAIERLELAASFRRLAEDSLTRALAAETAAERRSFTLSATAAAQQDLAIHGALPPAEAGDDAANVMEKIAASLELLDAIPVEELEEQITAEENLLDPTGADPPRHLIP